MNAKRNNNEVNTTSNQFAFERFCEFCKQEYYISVELKSKLRDKASFWITATKENEEREEIQLFLNQEILDLVLNYLESGELKDISKINPCDLESFNERNIEFKKELFQTEKGKGKEVMWSYAMFEKLASINYKQGIMIFHPYPYRSNPVNIPSEKPKQKTTSISKEALILIEINNLSFGSAHSLQVLSDYYTLIANKKEDDLLTNNSLIDNDEIKKQKRGKRKNFRLLPKLQRKSKHQVSSDL